jgi:hypothetical protein
MRSQGYFPEGEEREECYEDILEMTAKELHKTFPYTEDLEWDHAETSKVEHATALTNA